MNEKMVYVYSLKDCSPLNLKKFQGIFPSNFLIEESGNDYSCRVTVDENFSQDQAYYLVLRELDRIFFVTGIRISAELKAIENPDGECCGISNINGRCRIVNTSEIENVSQQRWEGTLAIQLCLWRLANSPGTPLGAKINLLFQIIESKYPDTINKVHYPPYDSIANPPDPKTECKLLRDYVSHQKTEVCSAQLKNYCTYIGYPDIFYDPTDLELDTVLRKKLNILKKEAKETIDVAIARREGRTKLRP